MRHIVEPDRIAYDYFKMFLADTGLFVTLAFMDRDYTENVIYRELLFDKLSADLGYVYENVLLHSSIHVLRKHLNRPTFCVRHGKIRGIRGWCCSYRLRSCGVLL